MSIPNETLAAYLQEQNTTLAAEIKRLEAEKSTLKNLLENVQGSNLKLVQENVELENRCRAESSRHAETSELSDGKIADLRARIALLESALQLPEGCDVFELQRAMKEGAQTKDGREWEFICEQDGDYKWLSGEQAFWFDSRGIIIGRKDLEKRLRLYCRKEANK